MRRGRGHFNRGRGGAGRKQETFKRGRGSGRGGFGKRNFGKQQTNSRAFFNRNRGRGRSASFHNERNSSKRRDFIGESESNDLHHLKPGRSYSRDKSPSFDRYYKKYRSRSRSPECFNRKRSRSRSVSPLRKYRKADSNVYQKKHDDSPRSYSERVQVPQKARNVSGQHEANASSRHTPERQGHHIYSSDKEKKSYASNRLYEGITDDLSEEDAAWGSSRSQSKYTPRQKSDGIKEQSHNQVDRHDAPSPEDSRYNFHSGLFGTLSCDIPVLNNTIPGLEVIEDEEKFLYGEDDSPSHKTPQKGSYNPRKQSKLSDKNRLPLESCLKTTDNEFKSSPKTTDNEFKRRDFTSDAVMSDYINLEKFSFSHSDNQRRKPYGSEFDHLQDKTFPEHTHTERIWSPNVKSYSNKIKTETFDYGHLSHNVPPSTDDLLHLPPHVSSDTRHQLSHAENNPPFNDYRQKVDLNVMLPIDNKKQEDCIEKLQKDVAKAKVIAKKQMQCLNIELEQLNKMQGDLHRKSRKVKDGHKNPFLAENEQLQADILQEVFRLTSDLNRLDNGILPPQSKKGSYDKEDKNVTQVYEDKGGHLCKPCNYFANNLKEFLCHLITKDHNKSLLPEDLPWNQKAEDEPPPRHKNAKKLLKSFKGSQFLLPAIGFYCIICSKFVGNQAETEAHFKSYSHNKAYDKHVAEDKFYERCWALERRVAETDFLNENAKKKELEIKALAKKKELEVKFSEKKMAKKSVEKSKVSAKSKTVKSDQAKEQYGTSARNGNSSANKSSGNIKRTSQENPQKVEANANSGNKLNKDPDISTSSKVLNESISGSSVTVEKKKDKISITLVKKKVEIGKFPFLKNRKTALLKKGKKSVEDKQCYDQPIGPALPPHMIKKCTPEQESVEKLSGPALPSHMVGEDKIKQESVSKQSTVNAKIKDVREEDQTCKLGTPNTSEIAPNNSIVEEEKSIQPIVCSKNSNDKCHMDEEQFASVASEHSPNNPPVDFPVDKCVPSSKMGTLSELDFSLGNLQVVSSYESSDLITKEQNLNGDQRETNCSGSAPNAIESSKPYSPIECDVSSMKSENVDSPTLEGMIVLDEVGSIMDPSVPNDLGDISQVKCEIVDSPKIEKIVTNDNLDSKVDVKCPSYESYVGSESLMGTKGPPSECVVGLDNMSSEVEAKCAELLPEIVPPVKSEINSIEREDFADDSDPKVGTKNQDFSAFRSVNSEVIEGSSSSENMLDLDNTDSKADFKDQKFLSDIKPNSVLKTVVCSLPDTQEEMDTDDVQVFESTRASGDGNAEDAKIKVDVPIVMPERDDSNLKIEAESQESAHLIKSEATESSFESMAFDNADDNKSMLKTGASSLLSVQGTGVSNEADGKSDSKEFIVLDSVDSKDIGDYRAVESTSESKEDSEEALVSTKSPLPQIQLLDTGFAVTIMQGNVTTVDKVARDEDKSLDHKLLQDVCNQLDCLADSTEDIGDAVN